MQVNRGVQLLKDRARSQLQIFSSNLPLKITSSLWAGTTTPPLRSELAIPNVPIDAAAFAETALVYSALLGKAPSNGGGGQALPSIHTSRCAPWQSVPG